MNKLFCVVSAVAVLLAASIGAEAVSYTITDLGTLDGHSWYPAAINNSDQIVGCSDNNQAVLWQNGTITDLGTGSAYAINNSGQIVGEFYGQNEEFFYGQNDTCPGFLAYAINDSSQVVGEGSGNLAYLWQNGTLTDLGTLPGGSWSTCLGHQQLRSGGRVFRRGSRQLPRFPVAERHDDGSRNAAGRELE